MLGSWPGGAGLTQSSAPVVLPLRGEPDSERLRPFLTKPRSSRSILVKSTELDVVEQAALWHMQDDTPEELETPGDFDWGRAAAKCH